MITLEAKKKVIQKHLDGKINRAKSMQGFAARNLVAAYRNVQRKRWITQNASEPGTPMWPSLNAAYAKRKLTRFKDYPGSGRKMMIATGELYESVIGPGKGFKAIAEPKRLIITTAVEHATWANRDRTFTQWSRPTIREFKRMIADFIFKNKLRNHT